MKGRMLFIFNPRSGKGQIRNKLMDIIDVFVKGGYEVVVHPTQGAKDAEKMAKSMAEEVDLIVCSGGDGTLDEVVTGLMEIGANVHSVIFRREVQTILQVASRSRGIW